MKTLLRSSLLLLLLLGVGVAVTPTLVQAQQSAPTAGTGVPVKMVVTVEAKKGKEIPVIHREDVMVHQGKDRDQVTDWTPLKGGPLQLFVLVDDALDTSVGNQLQDLRKFISSQAPTTAVGLAYMRNSSALVVQNPTTDHAVAAKAVRLPMGGAGIGSSPYLAVEELIKRWPDTGVRREVVMVSDGIDRFYGGGLSNPYVDTAVEEAQKAGILVYAIFATGFGHFGHSFFRVNWGQMYLSQLASETGGEAYITGFQSPVSFTPFLEDLSARFDHQFRLGFLAKPGKKPGLQSVKLQTEVPNAELVAADKVYVPAAE